MPYILAGDLLRAEQHREGSAYADLIQTCIREGRIVPMEVTVKLLQNAIQAALNEGRSGEGWNNGQGRFLVDGFPRKMDQALKFEEEVRIRINYLLDEHLIPSHFLLRSACPLL